MWSYLKKIALKATRRPWCCVVHREIEMSIQTAVALLAVCGSIASADLRWVEGTYRNPALGYAITVPRGLKGMTGDQAGPERGLRISLPSGGEIVVFGEPNSFEWKTSEEGVRSVLLNEACASRRQEVLPARIGQLTGAKGSLVCGDRVLKLFLVFRSGGGPIYWLRLQTLRAHESDDSAILEKVAASFKLIRWE
jgi:hypothetical protein